MIVYTMVERRMYTNRIFPAIATFRSVSENALTHLLLYHSRFAELSHGCLAELVNSHGSMT